jgi:hypothetical protein
MWEQRCKSLSLLKAYRSGLHHPAKIRVPELQHSFPDKMRKAAQRAAFFSTTYGSRTRHSSVKGRRLNRLTNAAFPVSDCKDNQVFIPAKFSLQKIIVLLSWLQ